MLTPTPLFLVLESMGKYTDIDTIDRPITTDITTRSQPANAYGGNAARRK